MRRLLIVEGDAFLAKQRATFFMAKAAFNSDVYHSINAFLERGNWNFDVAIIESTLLGKLSAFELANLLKQRNKPFIFLSGQTGDLHSTKVISAQPNAFYYKPVKNEDLEVALGIIQVKRQPKIEVRGTYGIKSLNPCDIRFIQTHKNYLDIVAIDGNYTKRGTLKDIIQELPNSFVQVSRFFVVNTNYIEQKSGSQLLIDSRLIPISKNYKGQLSKYA